MPGYYFAEKINRFRTMSPNEIIGKLAYSHTFSLEETQRDAWFEEINILQTVLINFEGSIYFEYSIPRMGKRIDVVLLIGPVVFVLEFKIGKTEYLISDVDQVWDYALDLKNFHQTSHDQYIAPILIATQARKVAPFIIATPEDDKLILPIKTNINLLGEVINDVLLFADGTDIDPIEWINGQYCPTPTIVEAAMALYKGHSVEEISRSDASAINLSQTSEVISDIIYQSKEKSQKSICFVTGVPGAGKTLVGLNIANKHIDNTNDLYSVFLSGNGPLVAILCEALARDKVQSEKEQGKRIYKGDALRQVKSFIQNVHNFRDYCLENPANPPIEHVVYFTKLSVHGIWNKLRNLCAKKDINQILNNQNLNS